MHDKVVDDGDDDDGDYVDVDDDIDENSRSFSHNRAHASHNCLVARPIRPRVGCATLAGQLCP